MKLRSLAIGLSLLTAGTVIGVTTQQFASAEISSGDRPVLVPIEPCRLVDTRPGSATVGPRSSPLGAADTLTVDAQEPGTDCTGIIPAEALSLSLNVTAIGASAQTFLTIWAGGPRPNASSLNPAPGAPPTPNAVTVDLSTDEEFEIFNNVGTVNLIVDVNGYYESHNHDDRYYTKAESDATFHGSQTSLAISPAGFTQLDSGWSRVNRILSRDPGGPASCVASDVSIPRGAQVEAVTALYQTLAGGDITVEIQGVSADFTSHSPFEETVTSEIATGETPLTRTRIVNEGGVQVMEDTPYTVLFCTSTAMSFIGVTIEFV